MEKGSPQLDCMEYCLCGRWLMSILLGHTTPGYMEDHTRRRPPYSSPLPPFSHTYTTKLAIITNRQTHRHTTVPLQAVYITYCTDPNLQHISPSTSNHLFHYSINELTHTHQHSIHYVYTKILPPNTFLVVIISLCFSVQCLMLFVFFSPPFPGPIMFILPHKSFLNILKNTVNTRKNCHH